MWRLLCGLWLGWVLLAGGAGAVTAIPVLPGVERLDLHGLAEVLEDVRGQWRLQDVQGAQAGRFEAARDLRSLGFTDAALWFRFTLDNPGRQVLERQMLLRTSWLDSVELYVPDGTGGHGLHALGEALPFAQRAYRVPPFVVDLQLAPGQHTYYLRVTSNQALMVPIELWAPAALQAAGRAWSAYYGMFYGILAAIVLYNAFIWTSTRDRNHLAYCGYLLAFLLMNASYNGFAYQFLWPRAPRWADWAHPSLIFLVHVMALWFSMRFLETHRRIPRTHRVLRGYMAAVLVGWAALAVLDNAVAYNAVPVYLVFVTTPLVLLAGLRAWASGYQAARFFVLANLASLIGCCITALTVSGLLRYSVAGFHAAEIGILIDVVLLSLALADRINLLRQERRSVQAQMVREQQRAAVQLERANTRLEQQVLERTAELVRARDAAERLARVDALTGVANRRWFDEVAEREFLRGRRYRHALSVAVFDIDRFKQINDRHGHAAGDAVLRAVADIVRGSVREVDFLARTGGEEFALLLPEVRANDARAMAERLREQIAAWRGEAGG